MIPGLSKADVAARDALISVLPVPNGGTELVPSGAGVRTWTFARTDWEAVRDDYLGVLRGQTYVVEFATTINDGGSFGESYVLADPSGTITVNLRVALFNGQTVIEVTR